MSRKAFTLVELLVVIAIIALLISILAPSLNIAKDIAKQVVCGSNLTASGKAIHMYANSHNDRYPPYRNVWKNNAPAGAYLSSPESTFVLSKVGDLDPMTMEQRWRGVGMVYGYGRYIDSPDYFYCPAQSYPWYVRESYQDPTQQVAYGSFSTVTNLIRTGYLWNMKGQKYGTVDPGLANNYWDVASRTLSQMETDLPLGMDHSIFPWTYQTHVARGQSTPTFNVMFADTHVEPFTPGAVYTDNQIINWGGSSGGVLKHWKDNPGENNDWEDVFKILVGT